MQVPGGRAVRAGLLAFFGALLIFFCVGGFRLGSRISGQNLPWSLIWPFARPLLAAALELAFLVSVPVALGVVSCTRSGRSGASWWTTFAVTGGLTFGVGALSFGASWWLDGRGGSPGQLATELVAAARESCVESGSPAEVAVPLLGFSWVCTAGRSPYLHGRAPLGPQATFQAATLALSDDLKRITLGGFELALPVPPLQLHVHVQRATLSGLLPWGRSRRVPFLLRGCLFVLSAGVAAYALGRLISRMPRIPAWGGALLGALVSCCLWFATAWLERQQPSTAAYLTLPASGLAGAVTLGLLWLGALRLSPRIRSGS